MSSADTGQFRDTWYSLAPPWVRTGNAEKYLYTLNLCSDILLDKMNQAVKIRMPGQGDPSQLAWLSNDRLLVQGPAEPNAAFALRLTGAFAAWKRAGARVAIMEQLQAYFQGLQPGVAAVLPEMTIVGGGALNTTWTTQYIGDPLGAPPTLATISPQNWNWDGVQQPWRAWLILYMSLVATGQSGSSAATTTASGTGAGTGHNVSGVWVPNTTSPINTPFLTITGLGGIVASNLGQWLTLGGSAHSSNNGTFPITAVNSATSVTIANPGGTTSDAGPLTWSIGEYPFIGPGPVWGQPGYSFGQGQALPPALDTGSRLGGIWEPSGSGSGYGTTYSWGLSVASTTIQSIRKILVRWKDSRTYYPTIIVAFDGGTGAAGSAYSPNSATGSGNPDGTFGGRGKRVSGVWVPNRLVISTFDAHCQGSGSWPGGTVEVT